MILNRLIVGLAEFSRRHALVVALGGLLLAAFSAYYAVTHLSVSTDTDRMFSSSLPWRQQATELDKAFPQFTGLLVAVIDAHETEEADATAAALADALAKDHTHFKSVRRPDASPFLRKEGLLFLDTKQLSDLMDRTIDAQPFLGQLVADPTSRGLFSALSLLGMGVTRGDVDLGPYLPSLEAFHQAMADALSGHPQPLSWQALLGGSALNNLAGKYTFVLVQPKLDFGALQPGGEATEAMRDVIANLEFVKSGDARVRITGQVALADEEFASVVHGAVAGLIGSVMLITLWLFLAVQTWRLILPILATLGLGLMLTLLFASLAVGTLNLVSVGFGILFVGIAVDFAIQFSVRYRERRFEYPDPAEAMRQNAVRAGDQILIAAIATSAGFLGFVPTDFSGVAELGLIAGVGMLIAFLCTLGFLPAIITLCHPRGEAAVVGFTWLAPFDPIFARHRRPIIAAAAVLAALAIAVSPHLEFDSDPLHTKNPNTEAMRTLYDLMDNPVTNPYSISLIEPNVAAAETLKAKLVKLPTVSRVINIQSFVPDDQQAKLAIIADANSILAPTLLPHAPPAPITPEQIRLAAKTALAQIDPALAKLPKDHPLAAIDADLHTLLTANDDVLLVTDRDLTRFLPDQLDRLRTVLSAQPVTLEFDSARRFARLAVARWPSARAGAVYATGAYQSGSRAVRGPGDGDRAERRRIGGNHRGDQQNHRECLPRRGFDRDRVYHDHPAGGTAARARRRTGAGPAHPVGAVDPAGGRAAAVAPQLREHHRAAAAAWRRRVVQRLLRDELASGTACGSRIRHGAGHRVLGADHRHGIRLARTVGAPRHRQHGTTVAHQPGLHIVGEPGIHSSAAVHRARANRALTRAAYAFT